VKRVNARLTDEENRKVEEMADKRGMTVSDVIRDLIRAGYDQNAVMSALTEIRAAAGQLAAQRNGNSNSADVAEIRRLVTLIASAMPSVAKHVSQ
jgi:hypothetical protein